MNWTEVSKTKDLEAVRTAVAELDLNERDERGRTPLMLLLTNRMPVDAIELLISKGADLEAEDKLGDTALKKAVKFKQKDAIVKSRGQAGFARRRSVETTSWSKTTPGVTKRRNARVGKSLPEH